MGEYDSAGYGGASEVPRPRGNNVIDLTSRLPGRPLPEEPPEESSISPVYEKRHALLFLLCIFFAMAAAFYGGFRWAHYAARETALHRAEWFSDPEWLAVPWPSQENRLLRLMGLRAPSTDPGISRGELGMDLRQPGGSWLPELIERNDPVLLHALAVAHLKASGGIEFLRLARNELSAALVIQRHHPGILNDLAVAYALSGELEEAEQFLREGMIQCPEEPALLYNAAMVARALGPNALEYEKNYLFRYLQKDPDSSWAMEIRKRFREVMVFRTRLVDDFSGSR